MPSPDITFTVTRFYNRPIHAIRVFERLVEQQAKLGRTLHTLTHIYSLGTGIRFRFEFVDSTERQDYRLIYFLGRLRPAADVANAEWGLDQIVPMKALWIPIGYFYLLRTTLFGSK